MHQKRPQWCLHPPGLSGRSTASNRTIVLTQPRNSGTFSGTDNKDVEDWLQLNERHQELLEKGTKQSKSSGSAISEAAPSPLPVSLSSAMIVLICILGLAPGLIISVLAAVFLRMQHQMEMPRGYTLSDTPAPTTAQRMLKPPTSTTTSTVPSPSVDGHVCHSAQCEYMSEKLRATMNFSIDPCYDFYQFTCGTIDNPDYLPFRLISKVVEPTIVSQFYTESVPPMNQTAWQKAAGMFKACFKLGIEEKSEVSDLKEWMKSLNLDLATLTPSEPYNSIELMVRCCLKYGFSPLFEFQISKLVFVGGKRRLQLTLSKMDERWLELKKRVEKEGDRALQRHYLPYLSLYTTDREELKTMFSNTFALDDQVIRIMAHFAGAGKKLVKYELRDLAHFTTPLADSDQWESMVGTYTNGTYNGGDDIVFNESTTLILQNLVNSAGPEGLRYLVAWSVFRQGVETALPSRLAAEPNRTLEEVCYGHVKSVMETALSSRYLGAVASVDTLRQTQEMVRRITAALRRSLETCHWLEGNSRTVALKKLDRMTANVGYPDELGNETMLEEYYRTFNDSTDRFFSTWLGARVAYQHRLLTDRETYLFNSVAANAFYTRLANRILIPAAILQPEIYFPDGPLSGAYGSLGQVIGHEIMHGFDVQGFKYDENNEARSWATPEAMEHYRKEALCLRESHKRAQMHMEPQPRQDKLNDTADSENIADLGGTLMAFGAFNTLTRSQQDVVLPAVSLTARQLFFVFQCAKWCYYQGSKSGRHARGRYRCEVPAMNMDEFSEAFRCKPGDRMYPVNKCELW
ncbi:neprilysin-1-like isoform X3 [Rhipicephalus microplus]